MNYRKMWEEMYGPIPKDEQGRSYEIHHIDGDGNNHSIDNLKCISIEEHYNIHLEQGDYASANMIAMRLSKDYRKGYSHSNETREKISASRVGQPSPRKGIKLDSKIVDKIKASKIGHIVSDKTRTKISLSLKGKKPSIKTRYKLKKSHEGKRHSEETKAKMRKPKPKVICPHCGLEGGKSVMMKWHFDNCKNNII
jgi:hypothetical protein